jgi:hypothetical protein
MDTSYIERIVREANARYPQLHSEIGGGEDVFVTNWEAIDFDFPKGIRAGDVVYVDDTIAGKPDGMKKPNQIGV